MDCLPLGTPSTKSWAGQALPLLQGIQAALSSCCKGPHILSSLPDSCQSWTGLDRI